MRHVRRYVALALLAVPALGLATAGLTAQTVEPTGSKTPVGYGFLTYDPAAPNNQFVAKSDPLKLRRMNYSLFVPPGMKTDTTTKYGVILYLHGTWQGGTGAFVDGEWREKTYTDVRDYGLGWHLKNELTQEERKAYPYIVVFPHSIELSDEDLSGPEEWDWNTAARANALRVLTKVVSEQYPDRVDLDRVVLIGFSRGGRAALLMAEEDAGATYAGVVTAAGWYPGDPYDTFDDALKGKVPFWLFHGAADLEIDIWYSKEVFKALGGTFVDGEAVWTPTVRGTFLPKSHPDSDHDGIQYAPYRTTGFRKWLDNRRRKAQ